jgi:sarcosine oxidase
VVVAAGEGTVSRELVSDNRTFDVIVVGAGIMGVAAAWELARRNHSVLVLEQYDLGHARGSSHGYARIFRLAYENEEYVALALAARNDWRQLELESGADLLLTNGAFDLGPSRLLNPIENALVAAGASVDRIVEFPDGLIAGVRVPDDWEALYQPDGGTLAAARCFETFVDHARAAGAIFRPETAAVSVRTSDGSARVETIHGTVGAQCIVITAAGWAEPLLRPLGIAVPIRVTREHVAYYQDHGQEPIHPFIWHPDDGSPQIYGLPSMSDSTVKIGRHIAGRQVEPSSKPELDPRETARITGFVRDQIPRLGTSPRAETCLYASTPDDDFIIDRVGPIILGLGFGGHGFKFAPAVGSLIADLVVDTPIAWADRFSLKRFDAEPQYAH